MEQTHKKLQQLLESKFIEPGDIFSVQPSNSLGVESNWMIRLTSLKVYKSVFYITEKKSNFIHIFWKNFHLQN